MKIKQPLILSLALLPIALGCRQPISRDEVARVTSPDSRLDAVLFEINDGATTSFGYEVIVGAKGRNDGVEVAKLYGATRNAQAYGVNLRWHETSDLFIDYLSAKATPVLKKNVIVEGRPVQVDARSGIDDPTAPSGGMLHNLRLRRN